MKICKDGLKNSDDVMKGGVLLACHHGLSDDMLTHMHDVCARIFSTIFMNIFITGANGYLAKNLVKEIVDTTNHNLILLVRENSNVDDLIKFVKIDNIIFYDDKIESLKGLQKYKIDLIFHLANYYPDAERPAIKEEIISSNFTLIANVLNTLGRDIFIPYKSSDQYPLNFRIINVTSHVVFDDKDQSTYKVTKELAFMLPF